MRQFVLILLTAVSLSGFFSPALAIGVACHRAQNTVEVEDGVVTASPYQAFQRQFNSKVISQKNMYVSALFDGRRLPGRLTAIKGNSIEMEVYDEGNYQGIRRVSGPDLESVRTSSTAEFRFWQSQKAIYGMEFNVTTYDGKDIKGRFERYDDSSRKVVFRNDGQLWEVAINKLDLFTWTNSHPQQLPEPSRGFEFRQTQLPPYKASNGQDLVVDLHSPFVRNLIGSAVEQAESQLGIRRGTPLTTFQRHQLYRFWLDHVIPTVEESDKDNYSKRRNEIIGSFNKQGQVVSKFVDAQACVCRELSVLTSSFLVEFGIYNKVAKGIVDSSSGDHRGGHAWIHVYDRQGNLLEVINTNGAGKNFFTDRDSFFKHRNVELEGESEIARP